MNNSTVSFEDHEDSVLVPYALNTAFSVANSVIALISLVGNFLVIICFVKTQSLRTSTNYYITNMTVSDLLLVVTMWMSYPSSSLYGLGSSLSCKFSYYLAYVSYSVSIESLVLITVDRFIATMYPLKVTMVTGKIRAVFILLTWIIPIGSLVPYLYFIRSAEETARGPAFRQCAKDARWLRTIYTVLGVVLLYFIPLIVIIILTTKIMKSLRRINPVIQGNDTSNKRRRKRNQRIMKVLITIIVFFFTCWTLSYLALFLLEFLQKGLTRDTQALLFILSLGFLPIVSTAFNPVILFIFSTNYRQALKDFLRPAVVKCRSCFTRELASHEQNIELPELQ